jgi:hypothetical protein
VERVEAAAGQRETFGVSEQHQRISSQ